jgi:nitrite reductase/ring-hydroxylating ferredoxin subunit
MSSPRDVSRLREVGRQIVTCPAHSWKNDVTTGFVSHADDDDVACHSVKIENGKVFVAVS